MNRVVAYMLLALLVAGGDWLMTKLAGDSLMPALHALPRESAP